MRLSVSLLAVVGIHLILESVGMHLNTEGSIGLGLACTALGLTANRHA